MTEELKQQELDRSIDSVISTGEFASTGDEGVDALARIAVGLRGLPNMDFKARLKAELLPDGPGWWTFPGTLIAWLKGLPVRPWLRRNRPFAVAGGGYGLLAGTCCLSGAAANVLGLASAAAVSSFIDGTLPYFVAVSVAGLAVWLGARVFLEQGLTLATLAVM